MYLLLVNFLRNRDNIEKLADFYYKNTVMLTELKERFPDWEGYVENYLSDEVRTGLHERGIPL